jgi:hypothetical protein
LGFVGFAGARIWLGRAVEEVRGGTGPYVVASPRSHFSGMYQVINFRFCIITSTIWHCLLNSFPFPNTIHFIFSKKSTSKTFTFYITSFTFYYYLDKKITKKQNVFTFLY